MADYLTFEEIYTEVERALKQFKSSKIDLVKAMINLAYFNMLSADELYPLFWLVDIDDTRKSIAPATITGISQAANGIFTTDAAHGFVANDIITAHTVAGMTEVNDRVFLVVSAPTTVTLTVGLNTSGYTAYTSGGTLHHRGITLATSGKNVQKILLASWHGEGPMDPITPKETEENISKYHYTSSTQRPDRYYHGKSFTAAGVESNQLIWHPGANAAYGLRYWLEKRTPKLVLTSDVPLMPPQFHYGIVAGAITLLAENNVQVEDQVVWPGVYASITNQMVDFNNKYWKAQERRGEQAPYLL